MLEYMHIFSYDFHGYELDFEPADKFSFEFWMTANVGDGKAGAYYDVHICTPMSIGSLANKRNVFTIDEWQGITSLIDQMNEFIESKVSKELSEDPYRVLGKYWGWEYEGM